MPGSNQIHATLLQLFDADPGVRKAACNELKEHVKPGLPSHECLAIFRAALRPSVTVGVLRQSSAEFLVCLLWENPRPELVQAVREHYGEFDDIVRAACLALLCSIESTQASVAFASLIDRFGWPAHRYPRTYMPYAQKARDVEILLPALMRHAHTTAGAWPAFGVLMGYLRSGLLAEPQWQAVQNLALDSYRAHKSALVSGSEPANTGRNRKELTALVALVLATFGHIDTSATRAELHDALAINIASVQLSAIVSLLRLGEPVSRECIHDVAANPSTRLDLRTKLRELDLIGHFPSEFATSEALAEAAMVHWLEFPTELDSAPDEIDLMETLTVEDDRGKESDYFLFRFRVDPPHWGAKKGWMAGVAGPVPRDADIDHCSDTFSKFEKWSDKTPREHFMSILGTLEDWSRFHFGNP